MTLKRIPYFIYYLIKSPFVELYHSILEWRSEDKSIKQYFKPSSIFQMLIAINMFNVFSIALGYKNKLATLLFWMLTLSYIWKVWASGDDIRDKREKEKKIIKQ